jgi:hypothetical protein
LGIEIMNQSGRALAVRQIRAVLPLGGLRAIGSQQGTCGLLPGLARVSDDLEVGSLFLLVRQGAVGRLGV